MITGTADFQQMYQNELWEVARVPGDDRNFIMPIVKLSDESVSVKNKPQEYLHTGDFMLEVQRGNIPGYSSIHKFGRNAAVGATLVSICDSGLYNTPTGTVTVAAISDDADDTAAGAGAQQVTIQYLDENFVEQTATIEMNGLTETTGTISGVKRIYRAWVSRSGSYATATVGSQQGTITIREAGAGITWVTIPEIGTTGFGLGQSLIGAYTVPAGKTAYILSSVITVDGIKTADLYFFARTNADDTTPPYSGTMRVKNIYTGISGHFQITHKTYEAYPEKTDIGWMAIAGQTSDISVEFEIVLIDN